MTESTRAPVSHWNYLLSLEDDLSRLSRYIELHADNYATYSLELARVLFAAASEVDVVARQLCRKLDETSKADGIAGYCKTILANHPEICESVVVMPQYGLSLAPWSGWTMDASPGWWEAYNKVKHHRHTHFSKASLKNALEAVAALFILLLFFYRDEARTGKLRPDPRLLSAEHPFREDRLFGDEQAKVYLLGSDPRL